MSKEGFSLNREGRFSEQEPTFERIQEPTFERINEKEKHGEPFREFGSEFDSGAAEALRESDLKDFKKSDGIPEEEGQKKFRFRVVSKVEDIVPPKLKSVRFSPVRLKAGEILHIEIDCLLDLSDVTSAQISLSGPKKVHSFYILMSFHPSKKRFVGFVKIPSYIEAGQWKIDRVYLQDGAGNPSVFVGAQNPLLKTLSFTILSPKTDVKAPILTSLFFRSKSALAGEFVQFEVGVSDKSPIKQISLRLTSKQGHGYAQGQAFFDPYKKKYIANILIPKIGIDGKWIVSGLSLSDSSENARSYSSTEPMLKRISFVVSGSQKPSKLPPVVDTKAPKIFGAHLAPWLVTDGESLRFAVDVRDAKGAVSRGKAIFADPLGAGRLHLDLWPNPSRGLWEGSLKVPRWSRSGIWSLLSLEFTDSSGNRSEKKDPSLQYIDVLTNSRLEKRKVNLSFKVVKSSSKVDSEAPVIRGFHLAPGKVLRGGTFRVFARLEDPGGSGISSASCSFKTSVPSVERHAILSYNSDTGFYEGSLGFASSDPLGKWWLVGCFLRDNAGHSSSISAVILAQLPALNISGVTSKASSDRFVIEHSGSTISAFKLPKLKAIHVSGQSFRAGGLVSILLDVEQGAKPLLTSVSCSFQAEHIRDFRRTSLFDFSFVRHSVYKLWIAKARLPRFAEGGRWFIKNCRLTLPDRRSVLYNRVMLSNLSKIQTKSVFGRELRHPHLSFSIKAQAFPKDAKPPLIQAISVHTSSVPAGKKLRVYLKASDPSGVERGFCAIRPSLEEGPRSSYRAVYLSLNPATGLLEGNHTVSLDASGGYWSLAVCRVYDSLGNEAVVKEDKISKLSILDLSKVKNIQYPKGLLLSITGKVAQPSKDKEAPIASSLEWYPSQQVRAGSSVLVRVYAKDVGVGIQSVSIKLKGSKKKKSLRLSWNSISEAWEAVWDIPSNVGDGSYKVTELSLADVVGNQVYYQDNKIIKLNSLKIQGSKPLADQKAPVLKKLTAGIRIVRAGGTVRFYASVVGEKNDVKSVSMSLLSPSSKYRTSVRFFRNSLSKQWEGEASFPKRGEDGSWSIVSFTALDFSGNQLSLKKGNVLLSWSIAVRGTKQRTDKKAPSVKKISIVPKVAKSGETVRVIASITDNQSGVARASVLLRSLKEPNLQSWITLFLNPATGKFEGDFKIAAYISTGDWKIIKVDAVDKDGNEFSGLPSP